MKEEIHSFCLEQAFPVCSGLAIVRLKVVQLLYT